MLRMVLSIDIPPQTEARLRKQAQAAAKDVNTYVSDLIEQAAAKPSLDELLASVRKQFELSGTSDEQLVQDISRAKAEYHLGKREDSSCGTP